MWGGAAAAAAAAALPAGAFLPSAPLPVAVAVQRLSGWQWALLLWAAEAPGAVKLQLPPQLLLLLLPLLPLVLLLLHCLWGWLLLPGLPVEAAPCTFSSPCSSITQKWGGVASPSLSPAPLPRSLQRGACFHRLARRGAQGAAQA